MHRSAPARLASIALLAVGLLLATASSSAAPGGEPGPPFAVQGRLEVRFEDDFERGRSRLVHFVEDEATGRRFRLRFDGGPPGHLKSGALVRVRGRLQGEEIYLAADGEGGGTEVLAAAEPAVAGEQRTLTILADLQDASLACSTDQVRDILFTDPGGNTVDALFEEMSLGQVWLSGDVVGPYTIDFSTGDTCDPSLWADHMEAEAAARGIDPSAYERLIYVLPRSSSCPYSGYGQVGGALTRSWIFRCEGDDIYAHELGHNLGMNHSSTEASQYGDTSDIMGYGGLYLRQINAPHQEQMGWRAPGLIEQVTSSGVYQVAPLELDGSQAVAPQILKLAKPDTGESYYLSYRAPVGFDANLPAALFDRLQVHRYAGAGARTFYLAALQDGAVFSDDVNGIVVTPLGHDSDSFSVQIDLGGETSCTTGSPSASLAPASQSGAAGDARSYALTVQNQDGPGCGASSFSLAGSVPSGWTLSVSPQTLTLAPGATSFGTLVVTSPPGAAAGSYALALEASDTADPARAASATASYQVEAAPCAPAPLQVGLTPASQSAAPGATLAYAVQVTNSDDASCPDASLGFGPALPAGWSGAVEPSTLSLPPGGTASATLTVSSPASVADGSHAVGVSILDFDVASRSTELWGTAVVDTPAPPGDSEAPTAPSNVSGSVKRKHVSVSWGASADNVGVTGYTLFRDGVAIGQTTGTGFTDRGVVSGSTYSYTVVAHDAAGNASAPGGPASVSFRHGGSGKGKGKNR